MPYAASKLRFQKFSSSATLPTGLRHFANWQGVLVVGGIISVSTCLGYCLLTLIVQFSNAGTHRPVPKPASAGFLSSLVALRVAWTAKVRMVVRHGRSCDGIPSFLWVGIGRLSLAAGGDKQLAIVKRNRGIETLVCCRRVWNGGVCQHRIQNASPQTVRKRQASKTRQS